MKDISQYNISIFFDTRRSKSKGTFPVKLRVYSKLVKKTKFYNLDIDLTEDDFEIIRGNTKVKTRLKEVRLTLNDIESRANKEAKKLSSFNFEAFETKLFRKRNDAIDLNYHYNVLVQENLKNGKIGTADSFKYSLKSLNDFHNKISPLTFNDITVKWLDSYEKSMLKKGKSITSIGIYLRALRIVFNNAIHLNDIHKEVYPFGKRLYKIPRSKKVKKALSNSELKLLFDSTPKTKEQEKAKDFWFFSYACNGMNLKDVALLKKTDLKGDVFSYYRAKTFDKTIEKTKIEIHLNAFSKEIIYKYKSERTNKFHFSIIEEDDNDMTKYKKVKNFTRFVNQHLKILARNIGINNEISVQWARHSFATNAIRKGASMEFISEALNHSDLNVTKNYFSGFEDKTKKEFAKNLMNF
jgi:site-specific recombinase XerD